MRSSLITGLVVVAFALGCGRGVSPTPTPTDAVTVPVPVPVPVPDAAPAPAPAPSPKTTRCTKDTNVLQYWQGEYPGPVLDVQAAVSVPGRPDPCSDAPPTPCTVPKGLYHPWAAVQTGRYATIRPILRYKALHDFVTMSADPKVPGEVGITAGQEIEILADFGEGFCQWRVAGVNVEDQCPEMLTDDAGPKFEQIPTAAAPEMQVLGVDCADGHAAWIDVDEKLLALPEVEEGEIWGYGPGMVGPKGSTPPEPPADQ